MPRGCGPSARALVEQQAHERLDAGEEDRAFSGLVAIRELRGTPVGDREHRHW